MSEESQAIRDARAACAAAPADPAPRLRLAGLLLDAGDRDEVVPLLASVLAADPGSVSARDLMARAVRPAQQLPDEPREFADPDQSTVDITAASARLADVAGLPEVKQRLEAAFLAPARNPELGRHYGRSARGGLLLYGPPGCGKTFLAGAAAGELGARFLAASVADTLTMWTGSQRYTLPKLFAAARAAAPCVLFLDEVDALAHKRSRLGGSQRAMVNQLLVELDGVAGANDGVFVLAATRSPWDVDTALRRPGRLDRTLLVPPPDEPARAEILRLALRDRPTERINLRRIAKATEGYSGADLVHLCDTAAERVIAESLRTDAARPIRAADLRAALAEVRPSTAAWLAEARNVVTLTTGDTDYDELARYLKRRKLL